MLPHPHGDWGNGCGASGESVPAGISCELALSEGNDTHSSTLAWRIPGMGEPGGLQSMGSLRCRSQLRDFSFTFHLHALEKEMATHSSVLAWWIPGMGEPGGLLSMGLHRVGHDWSDLAAAAAAIHSTITSDVHSRVCYKVKAEYRDQVWADPGDRSKRHDRVAQTPMVPVPHTWLPCPLSTPVPSWQVPSGWWKEGGKAWAWLQVYLPHARAKQPLDYPLTGGRVQWWRELLPVGRI